jgi:hypothetical protein
MLYLSPTLPAESALHALENFILEKTAAKIRQMNAAKAAPPNSERQRLARELEEAAGGFQAAEHQFTRRRPDAVDIEEPVRSDGEALPASTP